jgi:hypothetical protein
MESNNDELRLWVTKQIAYLDPPATWLPDTGWALTRLHQRARTERRFVSWPAWVLAAALLAAAILLLPAGRAAAQQFWQFLTVRRVAFIRVKPWPRGIPAPEVKLLGAMIPPIPANDIEQARWRVHYEPRMPIGALSGTPRLSTTFSLAGGTTVKVADLQRALQAAGVTDQTVPQQWDGAQLALHTSAVVIAEWPDIVFAQSLPPTLTAPAGFDFPAFSALIFRVLGVGPEEAQRLAAQVGTAWLAPIDSNFDKLATIEEIQLTSGPGTLVQEKGNDGSIDRTTLFWSVPDRVYLISGRLNRELAIATANAVQ